MTLCKRLRVKKNGNKIKNIDHKIKCVQGQKLWFQYWKRYMYILYIASSKFKCVLLSGQKLVLIWYEYFMSGGGWEFENFYDNTLYALHWL